MATDGISKEQGDQIVQTVGATNDAINDGLHVIPGKENLKVEVEKLP
jgi:hypothetical protein